MGRVVGEIKEGIRRGSSCHRHAVNKRDNLQDVSPNPGYGINTPLKHKLWIGVISEPLRKKVTVISVYGDADDVVNKRTEVKKDLKATAANNGDDTSVEIVAAYKATLGASVMK